MSETRIVYSPRSDTTPDSEIAVLANVYKLVLDCCHAKKNAVGVTSTNGDDAKKGSLKHEVRANTSLPQSLDRETG